MLKALLKKEFQELFKGYFNNKSGERRSSKSIIGLLAFFVLALFFLGGVFFFMAVSMIEPFSKLELTWLYFVIMGLLAVVFGVFGSVFNTFTALYKAKDNEFLLSLPIPPSKILFVRLISVYALSLLYESVIFIPAIIAYYIFGNPTISGAITSFLMFFMLAFLISVLTCVLGWLVALISSKLKNKSFITVIIALVFFGFYYYVCGNGFELVEMLIENAVTVGVSIKGSAYPLYVFGFGTAGGILEFLIVTLLIGVLVAITYFVMSKTFIKIVTRTEVTAKTVYKSTLVKQETVQKTLFKKELKRFFSNASYMLNCGMGVVFIVLLSIAALLFMNETQLIVQELALELPIILQILPILLAGVCAFLCSMNIVSAPSISLEGKNIWILQTLPVDAKLVLKAKLYVHYLVNMPFAFIYTVCVTVAFGLEFYYGILTGLLLVVFIMFNAGFGLMIGLKKPNLHWVNESYAIKQGVGVMICLFAGMIFSFALIGLGALIANFMHPAISFIILIMTLVVAVFFVYKWLYTKGTVIFDKLS